LRVAVNRPRRAKHTQGDRARSSDAHRRDNARLNRNPTIGPACTADVPVVLELWGLARSTHATTTDNPGDVQRLVVEQPGSLLIAKVESTVVGALIAAWDGWRGNMYRLAVHPGHRREGIATQLVKAGENHLRALGAQRITALVGHDDATAAAFWTAAGYPLEAGMGRRVRNL
jgi:ribosomal protein S18 acetylase RimI-like enzyme